MLRNGTEVELWNTNNYLYLDNNRPLYQPAPWVLAVNKDGSAFGVYADSAWRMKVNLQSKIQFTSDGPPFRVIVIRGSNPQEVLTRMSNYTGKIELPPLWALGYQQGRYSYYPQSKVKEIVDGFRSRNLPCDVVCMDIDYMNGFRIFTFDSVGFPDPAGLSSYLHQHGFKGVWMIDPAAKAPAPAAAKSAAWPGGRVATRLRAEFGMRHRRAAVGRWLGVVARRR